MVLNVKKQDLLGKTYSFFCKNFTHYTQKEKVIIKNKIITEKPRCFNCNQKLTFLKRHKKVNIEPPKFFISYKQC